jgi:hypothetical protein
MEDEGEGDYEFYASILSLQEWSPKDYEFCYLINVFFS